MIMVEYREKNVNKFYNCKKISTAINKAVLEGLIGLGTDINIDTLADWTEEAEKTGQFREYWEDKKTNTFFRFQIVQNENDVYIDLGYRALDI